MIAWIPEWFAPQHRWRLQRIIDLRWVASLFFLVGTASTQAGATLSPEGVVLTAVSSARAHRMDLFDRCCDTKEVLAHLTLPMSKAALLDFFRKFDPQEVRFEKQPVSSVAEHVTIRMIAPQRVEFDLIGTIEPGRTLWRIVAIRR